jgi:hypothetical protein
MGNFQVLENKQRELLTNLSENELKQYILYLTRSYYTSFREDNEERFNYNLNLLKDIVEHYKETYPNIVGFIYYNLFMNANIIITETATDSKIKLNNPFKYDLYESEEMEEELNHDIRKIFNKDRIRARYNEKRTNKTIE